MYCSNCGNKLEEGSKYCRVCGAKIEKEQGEGQEDLFFGESEKGTFVKEEVVIQAEPAVQEAKSVPKEAGCWAVFAKISFIFGLISLILCWIPYGYMLSLSFPGIVFGILGKRTQKKEALAKASKGLKLSIAATVLSLAFAIFWAVIFVIFEIHVGNFGYFDPGEATAI